MMIRQDYAIDYTDPYHYDEYGYDQAIYDEGNWPYRDTPMYWENDMPVAAPLVGEPTIISQFGQGRIDSLTKQIPLQDTWTLRVYRTMSCWAFDMPEYDVKFEALIHGTERVLDHWWYERFGTLPSNGDTMDMTITRSGGVDDVYKHEFYDTKLVWLREDDKSLDSNYYLDVHSKMEVWLCPFLKILWKTVPEIIYVSFERVTQTSTAVPLAA